MAKIIVHGTEITVSNVNGEDHICITDMLKGPTDFAIATRCDSYSRIHL